MTVLRFNSQQEAVVEGNGNGKKKRRKRIIYISIAAAVLVLAVVGVVLASSGGTKIDPSKLAKVEKGDLAKSVVATGKIEPITKVEIKSKASGIVKKLYVDYGDKVKKGQVLAELDREEIQARVDQARAQLEASSASLNGTHADLERAKVDAEGPDVPLLKRAYDRAQGMAKDGVVSASALDDAQKTYEMSLNKQNVSKAQLQVLQAKIGQAQGQVAQDRANLKQLEEQLGYTTIESPIDARHPFSRRRDRRRRQFHPRFGLFSNFGDDPRRHQRGLRQRQGGRKRYRQSLSEPARPN